MTSRLPIRSPAVRWPRRARLDLQRLQLAALRLVRVEAPVAVEGAGVALADEHLGVGQLLVELVQGADVIGVRVRQHDARDRRAQLLRLGDDATGGAGDVRVDEREAVVLPDEPRVDELQAVHDDGHGHCRQATRGTG